MSDGHRKLTDDPGVASVRTHSGGEVVLTRRVRATTSCTSRRASDPDNPFPWTVLVFAVVGALVFAQLGAMRIRRRRTLLTSGAIATTIDTFVGIRGQNFDV